MREGARPSPQRYAASTEPRGFARGMDVNRVANRDVNRASTEPRGFARGMASGMTHGVSKTASFNGAARLRARNVAHTKERGRR